jgi:hypothetical protein
MAVQAASPRSVNSMRVGLVGIALIAAASFSAGIGLGASRWLTPAPRTEALGQPAPGFDAPAFGIDEKLPLAHAGAAFDGPAFRLQEKLP